MGETTINKRFNKIMCRRKLKYLFKKVDNLEECNIVLLIPINNKLNKDSIHPKKDFKEKILPLPAVEKYVLIYLKHSNPRYNKNLISKDRIDKAFHHYK